MTKPIAPSSASAPSDAAIGRSIGILIGGQAGAQLLTMLVSPILTRLYGPQDFGALAAIRFAKTGVLRPRSPA